MKVLITGASGLLGPYLMDAFKERHQVTGVSSSSFDLTVRADVRAMLSACEPDVVIHAAAMTNVDLCEAQPYLALEVNRTASYWIAGILPSTARLIYISTDMVYPDLRGPHREADASPVNIYGRSKFAGESCVAFRPQHLILRTNFFGPSHVASRLSFSDWVRHQLKFSTETPLFFNDVFFNPLHMRTLGELIVELVENHETLEGIYNVGASTSMSKAAFAAAVAEQYGLLTEFNRAAIGPASWHVKRPHDLSMDCTKLETALGRAMPSLEEEIKKL